MTHSLEMQPDEHILIMVRKHWFLLLRDTLGTAVAGIIPLIGAFLFIGIAPLLEQYALVIIFAAALWLMLTWIALATLWTHYYLDMWIVTNKRIIFIEQVRLFSREITTLRIERIQDATVTFKNFIETMLNFGTLRIQSAGAVIDDLEVYGIPQPEQVKHLVLQEVDRQTQERLALGHDIRTITDEMTGA